MAQSELIQDDVMWEESDNICEFSELNDQTQTQKVAISCDNESSDDEIEAPNHFQCDECVRRLRLQRHRSRQGL